MDKHQKKGVLLRPLSQLLSNSFDFQNLVENRLSPGLAQVSQRYPHLVRLVQLSRQALQWSFNTLHELKLAAEERENAA